MADKTTSLLAAVSALGMSLGVGPVAQAQTADELAGGRKGGTTQVPATAKPAQGCPAGFINEQRKGAESGQFKQTTDAQSWSWGANNPAAASQGAESRQFKQGVQGNYMKVEGVDGARAAAGVEAAQKKQGQAGAYEFYAPKPNC